MFECIWVTQIRKCTCANYNLIARKVRLLLYDVETCEHVTYQLSRPNENAINP
jgi:hypothetical protein